MKNHIEINLLGTSFTIQVDEDPEYIDRIIKYLENKINKIQSTLPVKNPLKISLLACIFIIDELFKERDSSEKYQTELLAEKIIDDINSILEN